MKYFFYPILIFGSLITQAQVGIGTTDPQATLDIRDPNPSSPSAAAGIAIPQVNTLPSSGNRAGQLVYLTATNLYYYYNGSSWYSLQNQIYTFGDVKYGYVATDHFGWVLLNGRLKNNLTASQQTAATSLGIGTNLPDIQDKSIVGVSTTKALNTMGGSSSPITIAQNQLPNVTLTTSSDGAHIHKAGKTTNYLLSTGVSQNLAPSATGDDEDTSSAGIHNHTTYLNGDVTQQSLSIQNSYLALNGFIYLGL